MEWRIGCSGYQHAEWRRIFYPDNVPHRKWFEFYCEHFPTLELNATYYKFPRVEILKRWYARSPKDFSFTVKAPRHITHFNKSSDAKRMLSDFNKTVTAGLGEKLAAVLFQFPGSFTFSADRLLRILDMLDGSVRTALEFRHRSWWDPTVYEALTQAGVIFVSMSHPALPGDVVKTGDVLYYRFHGVPHLYNSLYDTSTLESVAQEMFMQRDASAAFVYFNNTADGHAAMNARTLQGICELVH